MSRLVRRRNKGSTLSPLVSFLPLHAVPFHQSSPAPHLSFTPFAAIPFSQFVLPLLSHSLSFAAIPSIQFSPYLSYHYSPPFAAIPLSQLRVTSNCSRIASIPPAITYPDLMKPNGRSRSGRLTRASRQHPLNRLICFFSNGSKPTPHPQESRSFSKDSLKLNHGDTQQAAERQFTAVRMIN